MLFIFFREIDGVLTFPQETSLWPDGSKGMGIAGYRSRVHLLTPINIIIDTWVFPNIGVPQNGWFIMENPIEMDDWGGTIIFGNIHIC